MQLVIRQAKTAKGFELGHYEPKVEWHDWDCIASSESFIALARLMSHLNGGEPLAQEEWDRLTVARTSGDKCRAA